MRQSRVHGVVAAQALLHRSDGVHPGHPGAVHDVLLRQRRPCGVETQQGTVDQDDDFEHPDRHPHPSRILYALPAWGGFLANELIAEFDACLRKAVRWGYS